MRFVNLANVAATHATHLQSLAEELERPIVLIPGGCRVIEFDPTSRTDWERRVNAGRVAEFGQDYDELVENGIILIHWSGRHANHMNYMMENLPGSLWTDDTARMMDLRDYMADWPAGRRGRTEDRENHDPTRYLTTEPVYAPNTEPQYLIGEVASRVVWFHHAIDYMPELRRFIPANYYDHAIRRSVNENFAAELAERVETMARQAFTGYMQDGRMSNRVRTVRSGIMDAESNIQSYRSRITQSLATLTEFQRELDALMQIINNGGIQWDEYWERLKDHPRITQIVWSEPTLSITTDEVQLRHPTAGTTVPLGTMRIDLNLVDQYITIHNLTNARGNRAHPHVNGTGPCFGEYEHAVYKMLADGDLLGLMELMFVYLETFNPRDDWGRYGAYWFRADGSAVEGDAATDDRVQAIANGRDPDAELDGGTDVTDEFIEV